MKKYGFIGCGNMGGALCVAVSKQIDAKNIYISNRTHEKAVALADRLGAFATDNQTIAKECDVIFLGVKPQMMEGMLADIEGLLAERENAPVLVTMAAALSIEKIKAFAGGEYPVMRIMPNTPASVGAGVILYSVDGKLNPVTKDEIVDALDKAGMLVELPEGQIDAASAVAGCGPAFVDMFIEALADGGVACGLPRAVATKLAAKMVEGSGKLVLESGKTPGELREAVCSPGGTTIEGVRTLEEYSFRAATTDAVIAAYEKTLKLK